jgi:hypothetical protein
MEDVGVHMYFMPFGLFYGHLLYISYVHLVYFVVVWYTFPILVGICIIPGKIWQPWFSVTGSQQHHRLAVDDKLIDSVGKVESVSRQFFTATSLGFAGFGSNRFGSNYGCFQYTYSVLHM